MKLAFNYKRLLPVLFFAVVSVVYFKPVLQGKQIVQSDIRQYIGMSKQQKDFHKRTGKETYWTDSAFGGMPTYLLGAQYPYNYIKHIDRLIRFLPRPADYLFLYFITFYILMLALKVDYRVATLGALAFGLSTYLIIILGVGHNAKAHAIGYFPLVLAGMLLIFKGRYTIGGLLTALAMGLEISCNHYQMTYYLMLLLLIFGITKFLETYKNKDYIPFLKKIAVASLATLLALMLNATSIMATKEYAGWSTRGRSELKLNPDGRPKTKTEGLDKDYITSYSYGLFETLDLLVPRLLGGSNSENLGKEARTYKFLLKNNVPESQASRFSSRLPTYWGDQPIVAAPAYVGAVILFLFVLSLFLVKGTIKKYLITGIIFSLILSWGKNFDLVTNFMIDYFPYYNKFRAVTSIQVILELCIPILAILGLQEMLSSKVELRTKYKALKWASIITFGIVVGLFMIKNTLHFRGFMDSSYKQYFGEEVMRMIRLDRKSIYSQDLWRTFVLLFGTTLLLFVYTKRKIQDNTLLVLMAMLIILDLWLVDKRYVNDSDFTSDNRQMSFVADDADKQIMKDKTRFRVWDPQIGINGARTSYFHNSIGGYHAAKPKRIQDVFDYKIKSSKDYSKILNMLNVKYLIQDNKAHLNPEANGNVWFVKKIIPVFSEDYELGALDTLDNKQNIIALERNIPLGLSSRFTKNDEASIKLLTQQPDKLVYESKNENDGLAVFSEMYYPKGWQVNIDGKKAAFFRVNYLLRALEIPKGEHIITFTFDPEVVKIGSKIALFGAVIFIFLSLTITYEELKKGLKTKKKY